MGWNCHELVYTAQSTCFMWSSRFEFYTPSYRNSWVFFNIYPVYSNVFKEFGISAARKTDNSLQTAVTNRMKLMFAYLKRHNGFYMSSFISYRRKKYWRGEDTCRQLWRNEKNVFLIFQWSCSCWDILIIRKVLTVSCFSINILHWYNIYLMTDTCLMIHILWIVISKTRITFENLQYR